VPVLAPWRTRTLGGAEVAGAGVTGRAVGRGVGGGVGRGVGGGVGPGVSGGVPPGVAAAVGWAVGVAIGIDEAAVSHGVGVVDGGRLAVDGVALGDGAAVAVQAGVALGDPEAMAPFGGTLPPAQSNVPNVAPARARTTIHATRGCAA
jgi:hypothetical protein